MTRWRRAVVVLALCWASVAHASEQRLSVAGLAVTAWLPPAAGRTRLPVILFSHGFHGCAPQSRFLTEALAAHGYLVFAPDHRDATCHGGRASWFDRSEWRFVAPQSWTEASFHDRADDLRRLLAALREDSRFGPWGDWSRVGLVGHSLGGYSVLGLAGAWPGWTLPGIKAVLALSPYTQPFVLRHTLAGLTAPVMYQGGTRDLGITPTLHKSLGSYDQSPPPKYYVEFDGAGHFAWTDIGLAPRDGILAYSVAFLDHYVAGRGGGAVLTRERPGVALLRYDSELGRRD